MNNNSFMVFSGTASRYLAEKICEELGCPLPQPAAFALWFPTLAGLVKTARANPA